MYPLQKFLYPQITIFFGTFAVCFTHSSTNFKPISGTFFKDLIQQPTLAAEAACCYGSKHARLASFLIQYGRGVIKVYNPFIPETIVNNWFMLSVRISSYGCTREVWRAREKRKSCSMCSREQL